MTEPTTRPLRFGIQVSRAGSGPEWVELARKAEDLGYSTLQVADHFGDQLAPMVAMQAAADATSTLRVGSLVFGNDYRHPVVLAKEAATLDLLSGGRLELGMGAGWMRTDYEQSGLPYDRPGARIDRLRESVRIVRGLLGGDVVHEVGTHYQVRGLRGHPTPVQKPVPLLIGGGGPKMLALAAEEADIVGVSANLSAGEIGPAAAADMVPARIDEKLQWVRDAAGDRFGALELNLQVFVCVLTTDAATVAANMAPLFGVSPEVVREIPNVLIGSEDEVCELILERRERWGFSYFTFLELSVETFAPVVARLAGT